MDKDSTTLPDLDNSELQEDKTPLPDPPAPGSSGSAKPTLAKRLKLILFGILSLILVVTTAGIIFRSTRPDNPPTPTPTATTSPSPSASGVGETRNLRVGGLSFPYPADWLLVFSPITDANSPELRTLYFARDTNEYHELASCASTGSCSTAPLRLTYTPKISIWPGYALIDFLRETKPNYPLDKLSPLDASGPIALAGYTDLPELTYQVILQPETNFYQSLVVSAREDTREMLSVMRESLTKLEVLPTNTRNISDLPEKHAYRLDLTARLTTGEFWVLTSILENLFSPTDSKTNPTYLLYKEASSYSTTNILNSDYYLVTDNPSLKTGKYSLAQVDATLSDPPIPDFVPYLESPKYCRENSDCVYRANFCTVDSYNRYQQYFTPWGCGPADYAGLGNGIELEESLGCSNTETLQVTPDSVECQENTCVAINPVPTCVKQ